MKTWATEKKKREKKNGGRDRRMGEMVRNENDKEGRVKIQGSDICMALYDSFFLV